MKVITFAQQKGGVGKTTLSLNFAGHWATQGQRVLVIDADPQQSAMQWAAQRARLNREPSFQVVRYHNGQLHRDVAKIGHGYDVVIIDAPGIAANITPSCIASATLCVIPIQPSQFDVWAAAPVLTMISKMKDVRPDLRAVFVINANTRARIAAAIRNNVAKIPDCPLVPFSVMQRTAFRDAIATGQTVGEYEPNGPASAEIAAVAGDVWARISNVQQLV